MTDLNNQQPAFNPATVFLTLALLIGAIYCVVIPYGAGFDEERHIVRIYDISKGYLLPNRNPPTYKSTITYKDFSELSYQRRFVQSPAFDMFSRELLLKRFGRGEENLLYGYIAGSIYSPVMFFPQAILARVVWLMFDLPILPGIILLRLAGLTVYVAGCWLAIRLLPVGQWILTVLALSPMALFQAATLNTDGFTNAASFLFIALTVRAYYNETETIQPREIWALITAALLLGLSKPGAVILLPVLLIFTRARFASRQWIILLGLGAALALLINVGWMSLAFPNSKFAAGGSDSLSRQFALVAATPIDFISTYVQGTFRSLVPYAKDWMAAYGYWAGEVPGLVYLFYPLLLFIAVLAEPRSAKLTIRARVLLAGLFFLASSTIMTLYFMVYYSPGDASALGRHGRYFIPFAPLLFIAISGLVSVHKKWHPVLRIAAIAAFMAVIAGYSFGIYAAYYTDCGYRAYVGEKCELPIYKNLEKEGAPEIIVNSETSVSQTFTSHCTGLEVVQIFIKSVPASGTGTLTFSLFDKNKRDIASSEFPVSAIQVGEYLTLPVNPAADSRNSGFEVRLTNSDLFSPDGIGVGFIPGSYHEGELIVAGQTISGDLIFHYICARP